MGESHAAEGGIQSFEAGVAICHLWDAEPVPYTGGATPLGSPVGGAVGVSRLRGLAATEP